MNARIFILATAITLLPAGLAPAGEINLPGHTLTAKDARQQASVVFLGQLVQLDPVKNQAAKGEYVGKVLYVQNPSNGIRPPYHTSQNTAVRIGAIPSDLSFPVTMKVGANESAPQVGKTYVFYARDNTRPGTTGYEALKLAPTSEYGLGVRAF